MRRKRILSVVTPLVVALVAAPFVLGAMHRASWATLGRDQGIFQYVAWAIREGDRLYADVRDVNGPLVALVHLVIQMLGGADEHRFRLLDMAISSAAFLLAGAAIPELARRRAPSRTTRLAWALATWAVLGAQYVAYGYWDSAQRESFFDWFVLAAIALHALAPRRPMLLALAGAASIAPCFGKPTYALFTLAQAFAIALDRRRSLVPFALGALGCAFVLFVFLALTGDPARWAHITFVDVPAMYRFIWARSPLEILELPGYARAAGIAVVASIAGLLLLARRRLSVHALPVVLMPALGLASVLVQAKGFPYHFHPVTLGSSLVFVLLLATAADHPLAIPFAAALGVQAALAASGAPFPPPRTDLAWFDRVDFFPRALRETARYVAAKTPPGERVQLYGMDAYVLFLARRKSATPYIYAYDLDADVALAGAPDTEHAARITAMRDENERDLVRRVTRAPPSAFVFVGRSPLLASSDAVHDFFVHCPDAAAFVSERYRETADFDGIRVWLRNDLPP